MIATSGPGPVVGRKTFLNRFHPAMVLAGFLIGGATDLLGGWPLATLLAMCALVGLVMSGWKPMHLKGLLKPWWMLAVLVLVVHTLTTTSAAPLGHPTWLGFGAGTAALVRLVGILLGLAWLQATLDVDDFVTGVSLWLKPVDRGWMPAQEVGLILAVALGTAPRVLCEGRRLQAVIRLRRGRQSLPWWRTWWIRSMDQVTVVVPLLEGLARQAETVSLTLRLRNPGDMCGGEGIPSWQLALLLGWALLMMGLSLLWRTIV